jgi:hypothetical protein
MIINSQFFITYYIGTEPLPLKTVPPSLPINSVGRIEYDTFIQAIDTIYGSQTLDGSIPKFWTRRTQSVDRLGNIRYFYEPHPDSTLSQLDSKSSYYFIIRDTTEIPLRVPSVGGLLLGFTDANKLPNVLPSSIPNTGLSTDSKYAFSPKIENLQPYEQYRYEFKTVNSNWPVSISSISGIIKPSTDKASIESSIGFCPSTGNCDTNIMPFILPEECTLSGSDNKTITMQLSIMPVSYNGMEVLSDQFTVECKDCLPKPFIAISGKSSPLVVEPTGDDAEPASYSFELLTKNLELDKSYSYSIEVLRSEWPFLFTTPTSGNIVIKSSTDKPSLDGKIFFCPTTGLCPPNVNGVRSYTVPSYPKFLTGAASYNVTLRAMLNSAECDTETIYSLPITISYKN